MLWTYTCLRSVVKQMTISVQQYADESARSCVHDEMLSKHLCVCTTGFLMICNDDLQSICIPDRIRILTNKITKHLLVWEVPGSRHETAPVAERTSTHTANGTAASRCTCLPSWHTQAAKALHLPCMRAAATHQCSPLLSIARCPLGGQYRCRAVIEATRLYLGTIRHDEVTAYEYMHSYMHRHRGEVFH